MKGVNDRVEEFIVKQLKCGSKAVSSYELALQTCQLVKVSDVATIAHTDVFRFFVY